MNSDVSLGKHENLTRSSNARANKHNPDVLQVFPEVPDTRLNNVKLFTEQKVNSNLASTSTKNANPATGKCQTHKLVNSKQVSGPFQQSDKKAFLLDTYARIAATTNKRCPKRLRELAKPKRQFYNERNNYPANFDLNYYHATKSYGTATNHSSTESKK